MASTITRTFKAEIYGDIVKVEEVYNGGQNISYNIHYPNGDISRIPSNVFWSWNPKEVV